MADGKDDRAGTGASEQPGFVPRPRLEDYSRKYARFFRLERRNGILLAQMQTDGGSAVYGLQLHNAWSQLWQDIGNDPGNEVLIFAGAGREWLAAQFDEDFPAPEDSARVIAGMPADLFYDQIYADATKLLETFIFNIDIPTIACINGPGSHTEVALMCDITLCADHAELFDPHFEFHLVPGDGQGLTFQELMGAKRSAYYLYTSEKITAEVAREIGLVNEVMPLDDLLPRAWAIAELIMKKPRHVRRFTSALLRRQWKQRLVQDLGFHLAHELLGIKLQA